MNTILDKLRREPTLALDRMQDIGGCRVVLPSRGDVDKLVNHLLSKSKSRVKRVSDYIREPRRSGYRGVHIILEYGGDHRPIEVQIRTQAMHTWATTVEEISGESGVNYKQDGLTPMQRFLECYARLIEYDDLGQPYPAVLIEEYAQLYSEAFEGRTLL
jgi:ppGpp synthetase/RelA/SpoT-type nucleotidyltranferase